MASGAARRRLPPPTRLDRAPGRWWLGRHRSRGRDPRSTRRRRAATGPAGPGPSSAGVGGRCADPRARAAARRRGSLVHQLPFVGGERGEDAGQHPPGGGQVVDPLPQRRQQHPGFGQRPRPCGSPRTAAGRADRERRPPQCRRHGRSRATRPAPAGRPGHRLRGAHLRTLLTEALFLADHQVSGTPVHD